MNRLALASRGWPRASDAQARVIYGRSEQVTEVEDRYAFPHTAADERRRLELFEQRLDPITIRRIERLAIAPAHAALRSAGAAARSLVGCVSTSAETVGSLRAI
jgi:hypothetical protein